MANISSPLKVIRRWASWGCSVSAAVDRLLRNSNVPLPEPVRLSHREPARHGAACRPRDPIRRRQRLSTKSSPTNLLSKYPGCPPIPDVMSAIITYMVTFDRLPDVDRMGRPLMFYGQRIHDKCYRRAHFDAGEFVQSWDDDAARKGYCLYKMGCKGPTTYNACSSTRWNDGVSFPISQVTAARVVRKMVSGIAVRSTAAWSIFHKWVPIPPPTPSV